MIELYQIGLGIVFLILVGYQVYFWIGYLWTRCSKSMSTQREVAKMLARTVMNKPPKTKIEIKKKSNKGNDVGYA